MALEFAESKERAGCPYFNGLYRGYIVGYQACERKECLSELPSSNRTLLKIEAVYDGTGTSVTTYRLVDENGNILMLADKATCEWWKEHGC